MKFAMVVRNHNSMNHAIFEWQLISEGMCIF